MIDIRKARKKILDSLASSPKLIEKEQWRARSRFRSRTCTYLQRHLRTSKAKLNDRSIISSSEKKQDEFRAYVLASKEFSQTEKATIQSKTFEIAKKEAISAQARFDRKHQKGCGLWSKRYQDTATIVQGVIDDFSPLIELVKIFAAPFGCMAVGTVSLFFQARAVITSEPSFKLIVKLGREQEKRDRREVGVRLSCYIQPAARLESLPKDLY